MSGMRSENSRHGAVPTVVVGLTPLEEEAEDFDEFFRLFDGVVEGDAAILKEEGLVGRWKRMLERG